MKKRKPVLFIDDKEESKKAVDLFIQEKIDYVEYHIKKFEESCCGEVPTTITPSVFAPEGVYKELTGIRRYIDFRKKNPNYENEESESAFW